MAVGAEVAAIQKAGGAGGEAAGETDGVVAILHQPVGRDVAFGSVEEAGDGGAILFERGAGDAGEVAGVEVGIVGDGGGMHGEEEQEGARNAVADDLDELQRGVGGEIARAALGAAIGTGRAEAAAVLQDAGAEGFGIGEEGRDGAIALDAGRAAAIEAQFVGKGGMSAGVVDGIDDGGGDLRGEEIEENGREVGEGSGESVIDFGGREVGGTVMGMCRGEHEFFGAQALPAIDGFEHLGVQAGGNGE